MTEPALLRAMVKIDEDVTAALSTLNKAVLGGDMADVRHAVDLLERRTMEAARELRNAGL